MRNIIFSILTLFLFYGCESNILGFDCHDGDIDVSAPSLNMDENGYYHLDYDGNSWQTFTTLNAWVGITYHGVSWYTESSYDFIDDFGNEYTLDVVNSSSISDSDGLAHTVLGVIQEMIGDTITVYAGYNDYCSNFNLNSIMVIIDE
tara:strand:- start:348 stop:788 length:441 start_codon:yes stop_codon:yes gene_type:complete